MLRKNDSLEHCLSRHLVHFTCGEARQPPAHHEVSVPAYHLLIQSPGTACLPGPLPDKAWALGVQGIVVADRGYFDSEEILACDDAGISVTLLIGGSTADFRTSGV